MRFFLICLLGFINQAIVLAHAPPVSNTLREPLFCQAGFVQKATSSVVPLVLTVDSIHHVNCSRLTGYLRVVASGGLPAYSYLWSNGNTGTLATNLVAGNYSITVTDDEGSTATVSAVILEDFVPPVANAGSDFNVTCANSITSLNGTGSVGAEFRYLWTATNGGVIQSGATTLTPVIKHIGSFTLLVTNIVNGCTSTSSVVVLSTYQPPLVTATGGNFSCYQPSVVLNSTYPLENTTFVWNGPGMYVSYALHPQVSTVGTFVFKVTDTLTTCVGTANAVVTGDTSRPVVLPTGAVLNCSQPITVISGTYTPMMVNFTWTGPFGFMSNQQTPVVSASGTYFVTVTNPANGCSSTKTTTVTSNFIPPTAMASVNAQLTCVVNTVLLLGNGSPIGITYSWSGPGGFNSTVQNALTSVPGVYVLTTQNPINGCTSTASTTVILNNTPPGVTAVGGLKTCINPTVTLLATSNTPGVTFKWSGPNNFISTLPNPVVSLVGTYAVTATNPVNGCTSATTVSVTQNITTPTLTTTTATINCYNPAPHVLATSQTNGATFSWSGPNGYMAMVSNPVVVVGGTYSVTVTNPLNGCTNYNAISVAENLALPTVYAGEDRALNCNFSSVLVNPIGTSTGVGITYLWTTVDGSIFSGATSFFARFDAIGHYTLSVKNTTSGCIAQDSMEVTQTPPLSLAVVLLNPISCNGNTNASVKATPIGGSGYYTYLWSTGSQAATLTNLGSATYVVTTTDSEGCSAAATISVVQPPVVQASVTANAQTQVGVNNGSASVMPSGGTAPYTIHWSNAGTTLTIPNLAPGIYTVTVTDSKGCTKSNSVTVNAVLCTITGVVAITNLNCPGVASGVATVNVTNVPTPLTYNWSNGMQSKTAANLSAGNYSVTVTGSNGCSIVLSAQIASPPPLVLSVVSNTGVTCAGLQNGAATFNASGGTDPYTYAWSNGGIGSSVSTLGTGNYTVVATDGHGCTVSQTTQISGPPPVELSVVTATDVACVDGQSGAISVIGSGGTAPLGYVWSNNETSAAISGLGIGNYRCTVTDSKGCSKNLSVQVVATDNVPPQLMLKNASTGLSASGIAQVTPAQFDNGSFDQSCGITAWTISPTSFNCTQLGAQTVTLTATDKNGNTATGTATVTVTDNIAPVLTCPANQMASYCSSTVFFNEPLVQDNCTINGTPTLISGLVSGSGFPVGITEQRYSVTDAGGNASTCSFTITITGSSNVTTMVEPTTCAGGCDGSASLVISGGGAIPSVVWSNGQSGLVATNLCPGNYVATLSDGMGCTQAYVIQIQVQDTQVPVLICPNNVETGNCNTAVTFTQPQVLDNCTVNNQLIQLISGLPSGSSFPLGVTPVVFRYIDGGGNIGECSFNVTVHYASSINSSATNTTCAGVCNGTAIISISGGQGPFGILWSNGDSGMSVTGLCAGMYSATISDADGCTQVQPIQISQPSPLLLAASSVTDDIANTGVGSITVSMSGGIMPYHYVWTRNGQAYATTQNIPGLYSGEYVVVVTDANGCSFTSALFLVGTSVATTGVEGNTPWKLFPNPAQSEIWLELNAGDDINTQLSIIDAAGRILLDRALLHDAGTRVRIDLRGFPDGILLVRLTNRLGSSAKYLRKVQ
jgi:hypothetical protein